MKSVRWTAHALQNLLEREVSRAMADQAVTRPDFVADDQPGRKIRMHQYYDTVSQHDMLIRVVVEETDTEIVVITVYRTSQVAKYLRGLQ